MFVGNWEGGDHVTTETVAVRSAETKARCGSRLYAAWFRCMLADDPVACKMFTGGRRNCGIWGIRLYSLTSKNL
jgi:hypothetical protein